MRRRTSYRPIPLAHTIIVALSMLPVFAIAQTKTKTKTPIPDSLEPTADVKNVGKVKVTGSSLNLRTPKGPVDEEELKRQVMRQLGLRPDQNVTIKVERRNEGPQLQADAETSPSVKTVGAVEVKGRPEDFRDPTKTIIDQSQLADPSDRNLLDVLEKQSGIIVRGESISMNGLPASYTQILYDGRKMPAGVSLATLRPDEIERIEISQGADAAQGAGGMAGTINVIPKKTISQRRGSLTANFATGTRVAQAVSGSISDRFASGSNYTVFGNVNNSSVTSSASNRKYWRNLTGQSGSEDLQSVSESSTQYRSLNGRANIILPDASWLGASINVTRMRPQNFGEDYFGFTDDRRLKRGERTSSTLNRSISPELTWDKQFTAQLSLQTSARYTKYATNGTSDYTYAIVPRRSTSWNSSDGQTRFGDLLFSYQPGAGKELQVGGSAEAYRNRATSTVTTVGNDASIYYRLSETTQTEKAWFAKWAHRITPKLGLNAGLRWTSIDMRPDHAETTSSYHYRETFLTPSFNLAYKASEANTFLFNYSRTFQAPLQGNLDERNGEPSLSEVNRPLNAIYRGNAGLKAEVTDSSVFTFTRRWSPTVDTNINASYRRIDNPLSSIIYQENGYWFRQPVNLAATQYYSISLSGKYWRTFGDARKITVLVTPSFTRSWNRIDGIAADGGGLGDFIPISASLGIQLKNGPVVAKLRVNYTSSIDTFAGLQTITRKESVTSGSVGVSWAASPQLVITADVTGIGANRGPYTRTVYAEGERFMSSESVTDVNPLGPTASVNFRYRF